MKGWNFLLAGVLVAMAPWANAEWRVRVTLQVVQMPQADALKIVPRLLETKSAVEAYEEVQQGLGAGKFTRIAELSGNTLNGESVEIGEGRGFSFPLDHVFGGLDKIGPGREAVAKSNERVAVSHAIARLEAREVGVGVRVTPRVFSEGKLVQIEWDGGATQFERWERTELHRLETGLILYTRLPIFRQCRSNSLLSFAPAVPQVAAIYHFPGAEPKTELHLVTANVRELPELPPPVSVRDHQGDVVTREMRIEPRPHGVVEVQRFHVSQNEALALRPSLFNNKEVPAAWAKLLEATALGRARLMDWQVLQIPGGHGQTSGMQNLRERHHGLSGGGKFDFPQYSGNRVELTSNWFWGDQWSSFNYKANTSDLTGFFPYLQYEAVNGAAAYEFQSLYRRRETESEIVLSYNQKVLLSFTLLPEPKTETPRKYEIILMRRVSRD